MQDSNISSQPILSRRKTAMLDTDCQESMWLVNFPLYGLLFFLREELKGKVLSQIMFVVKISLNLSLSLSLHARSCVRARVLRCLLSSTYL